VEGTVLPDYNVIELMIYAYNIVLVIGIKVNASCSLSKHLLLTQFWQCA